MARWCKSWSGLVLCFIALHQQVSGADTPDVVAVFSDTAIAAAIDAAVAAQPAAIGVITAADLPKTRPPFPTAEGYNFCDYTCATKIIVKAGDETSGVLDVEVRYKPLAGVTAAMMQWLFNSLTGTAKYYGNGQTYPMYLIFHPRDHVFHLASKLPVAAGVTDFTWCEMILTNCKYNRRSATKPWTCPATARGYVQSTPASRYDTKLQTKEVLSVSRFDGRGIEFNRAVNLADYGLSGNRTVATTRHTWSNTARGLSLRTQLWIGLMVEGSNTQFDTGFIGSAAKNQIINSYVGGATNINNKNMTQVGWMNALHFLEEYGGLKNWLPQVYAGRTRK